MKFLSYTNDKNNCNFLSPKIGTTLLKQKVLMHDDTFILKMPNKITFLNTKDSAIPISEKLFTSHSHFHCELENFEF